MFLPDVGVLAREFLVQGSLVPIGVFSQKYITMNTRARFAFEGHDRVRAKEDI